MKQTRTTRTMIDAAWRRSFLAHIERTESDDACWIWTGTYFRKKCIVSSGKRSMGARRVAWAMAHFDELPPADQNVYPHCGVQKCVNPRHMFTESPMDRFMAQVRKTEHCWWWTGPVGNHGAYGKFYLKTGNNVRAHRWLFMQMVQPNLKDEEFVCHRCDNKLCVRPSHMFVGLAKDNCEDMWRKGRGSRGPKHSEAMRRARARERSLRCASQSQEEK